MNTKKIKKEGPCIDLRLAQELYAVGKLGLKQLNTIVDHAQERGVDVRGMREQLKKGKATERMAKHLLETALKKYPIEEKEV
jgi:hypothetical protein